nr:type II secretion system F family protein [bacterium]
IVGSIIYYQCLKKYPKFKRAIHAGILNIPLLGRIIIMYELFHILRALGYMYGSGSDIKHAISTSKAVAYNICFKEMITDLEEQVERGVLISKTLHKYPILVPATANQLIAIAETTGTLSETCIILSDMYEQQTESIIKKLSHILEPLLMITMGLIVGFISLAMITPIYSISQKLHP